MKITIETILNSVAPYRELQTLKFSPRTSLNIYKLGKELDRELQTYRDVNKGVFDKYEVPETPQGYDTKSLAPEVHEKLVADIQELMESEVDIQEIKIGIEELERSNNEISPNTMGALEWMLVIPEEEKIQQGEPKPKKAKAKTN